MSYTSPIVGRSDEQLEGRADAVRSWIRFRNLVGATGNEPGWASGFAVTFSYARLWVLLQ